MKERVILAIGSELKEKLKDIASDYEISMSEFVRQTVQEKIDRMQNYKRFNRNKDNYIKDLVEMAKNNAKFEWFEEQGELLIFRSDKKTYEICLLSNRPFVIKLERNEED